MSDNTKREEGLVVALLTIIYIEYGCAINLIMQLIDYNTNRDMQ